MRVLFLLGGKRLVWVQFAEPGPLGVQEGNDGTSRAQLRAGCGAGANSAPVRDELQTQICLLNEGDATPRMI